MSGFDPASLPRVFGRPYGFDVECPSCGAVYQVRERRPGGKNRGYAAPWSRLSSRLSCHCGRVWIVGLALWEPPITGNLRPSVPRDQVPDREELSQLRQQTGAVRAGRASHDKHLRVVRTNLAPECTCEPIDRIGRGLGHIKRRSASCPLHGDLVGD